LNDRLAALTSADANDYLYQWDSSRDYNAAPGLEKIKAALLAINGADDERNPPETGLMDREIQAGEERQALSDPGERGHPRPRHDRDCEALEAAVAGVPAGRAEAGDVSSA
jgi:homoserine O-acetyltransferase